MCIRDRFRMSVSELMDVGFDRCVDHPQIPGHVYYEGYKYAGLTTHPLQTTHPRNGGVMTRLAAPTELRSFLEALRRVNDDLFQELRGALLKHEAGGASSQLLAQCIADGRHFSDLSLIHI
eukprot:TRINITY_DN32974_c0_g1_i2.p1 TRINITY_DN32974_c0_g1~~TRINITY_DN32974_c0_g1_i2.p1  ORF type:complete len:121 (+),score=29.49 TRINITY_DN32974_c0_g1_i2:93-455(+)